MQVAFIWFSFKVFYSELLIFIFAHNAQTPNKNNKTLNCFDHLTFLAFHCICTRAEAFQLLCLVPTTVSSPDSLVSYHCKTTPSSANYPSALINHQCKPTGAGQYTKNLLHFLTDIGNLLLNKIFSELPDFDCLVFSKILSHFCGHNETSPLNQALQVVSHNFI